MTSNASFIRKVTYIVAIALLLIPLSLMSRPTTVRRDAGGRMETRPGGTLSQMRMEAGLSQAQLGDIDPASETMKLATFGMRGVAVVLLWDRANEFKKTEDWDNFSATLEQIARLQPNFVSVWEHQAHNMSYNVSVEFDDYKQRYHWVKKGIDYLMTGTEFNRDEPRLLWYTGWVVGQKMGRSDERVQFRRMFRDDKELHDMFARRGIDVESAKGADGKPDNWLVGRLWYLRGTHAVDNLNKPLGGKSPALFHSSPVMSRINFASDLEKEEPVDWERTRAEWAQSSLEWKRLGDRPLPTSGGFNIRLNDVERLEAEIKEEEEKLEELLPGVRRQIRDEKIAALPADLRKALEKHGDDRTATDHAKAYEAEQLIAVGHGEVAQRAPADKRLEAQRTAERLAVVNERLRYTHTNRQVTNYNFWAQRAASGADELSSAARQHLIEARDLYARPDLEGAKQKYEQSFKEFAEVFERWPAVFEDAENDDLLAAIENEYIKVLEQLDLRDESGAVLPADFPLVNLLKHHGKDNLLRFRQDKKEAGEEKAPSSEATTPKEDAPPTEDAKDESQPKDEAPPADEADEK